MPLRARVAVAVALLAGLAALPVAPAAVADDGEAAVPATQRTMLVLDSSGSMKESAGSQTKIEAAREALRRVVDALPAQAEVGVRVFGAEVFSRDEPGACRDSQQVVAPAVDNRAELLASIDDYRPYGETPIGYALEQAARDLGRGDSRSIVLVSDGVATCEPDPCEVARHLSERGIDLRIDVVGLAVNAVARAQLRCIAGAADGDYFDAADADEIVDSLVSASERALRPFEIDGEVVRGSTEPAGAPAIGPGRFADALPRQDDVAWYRVERSIPGSTIVASYYELTPGLVSEVDLDVTTLDGESCDGGRSTVFHPLFTGYDEVIDADECDGDLLLEITRGGADARTRIPYGFGVIEVPPLLNEDSLPPAASASESRLRLPDEPRRRAVTPVVAGATFEDAAPLESGASYAATIVPGEVNAFRVSVGWGQRLAVRVDRPALTIQQTDVLPGFLDTDVQILNPARATVSGPDSDGSSRLLDSPTVVGAGTVPVRWAGRSATEGTFLAGDYTVLYSADFESDRPLELPYTITVEVQGPVAGEPEFADDAEVVVEPAPPSASADDGVEPTADGPAGGADDAGGSGDDGFPLGWVALALAGLTLLGGAIVVLRRRA